MRHRRSLQEWRRVPPRITPIITPRMCRMQLKVFGMPVTISKPFRLIHGHSLAPRPELRRRYPFVSLLTQLSPATIFVSGSTKQVSILTTSYPFNERLAITRGLSASIPPPQRTPLSTNRASPLLAVLFSWETAKIEFR